MICKTIEEITRNQADLDPLETSCEVFPQKEVIYRIQGGSFLKFNRIKPLSFRNQKIFPQSMVVWL
jgi:hypothetical protein